MLSRLAPQAWLILLVLAALLGRASNDWKLPNIIPDGIVTPDEPAPIEADGNRIAIIAESFGSLTPGQMAAIHGRKVRDYIATHCSNVGGEPEFRILDPSPENEPKGESEVWRQAWETHAKGVDDSKLPLVIVSNGKTGAKVPVPDGEDAMLDLLKKYLE